MKFPGRTDIKVPVILTEQQCLMLMAVLEKVMKEHPSHGPVSTEGNGIMQAIIIRVTVGMDAIGRMPERY